MNRYHVSLLALAFMFALAGGAVGAAPFLSTAPYPDSGPQPTIFLLTLDGGEEEESAAYFLFHTYTFTITAYDAGTTYRITIGGANVDQVGTGGTTTTTATALTTALNASGNANFTPITWTSNANVITGTHDTRGVQYTPTTAEISGAGTIGDPVETVEADEGRLLYDLREEDEDGIKFGAHTVVVKAQNNTATSDPVTHEFDVGVDTPNLIIIPSAP